MMMMTMTTKMTMTMTMTMDDQDDHDDDDDDDDDDDKTMTDIIAFTSFLSCSALIPASMAMWKAANACASSRLELSTGTRRRSQPDERPCWWDRSITANSCGSWASMNGSTRLEKRRQVEREPRKKG